RVEAAGQHLDHMRRHGGVDLPRQFDEPGGYLELARAPGQVEGVDGNAVPAEARTGVEGHVAEGLGLGGLDHLPDVDAHGAVDQLQLVHQGDVDRPEDVLGDL